MARQSITFTEKNNDWLNAQIDSKEYASKSELVNNLIRQARGQEMKIDWIREKLNKAEKNGFTKDSQEEILKIAKIQEEFSDDFIKEIDKREKQLLSGKVKSITWESIKSEFLSE